MTPSLAYCQPMPILAEEGRPQVFEDFLPYLNWELGHVERGFCQRSHVIYFGHGGTFISVVWTWNGFVYVAEAAKVQSVASQERMAGTYTMFQKKLRLEE